MNPTKSFSAPCSTLALIANKVTWQRMARRSTRQHATIEKRLMTGMNASFHIAIYHYLKSHANKCLIFGTSSRNLTQSPSTVSPVATRSISGTLVDFDFTDMHLPHGLLQRRLALRFRLFCLGRLSDGNSGSLKAFFGGDYDEGDDGVEVYYPSDFLTRLGRISSQKV